MGLEFRRKSGRIFDGSRLIPLGEGIKTSKIFQNTFSMKRKAYDPDPILPSKTPIPSITPTSTPPPTPTPSITPTITPTMSVTPTITMTNTPTLSPTNTVTPTSTSTLTPTNTPTSTLTLTPTNTPTITPTITPTLTQTPTPTPTPTNTGTPTPTPTPSGELLNNYMATQCSQSGGAGIAVVDPNLLSGGTGTTFLGSDGNCWYVVPGITFSGATVTPLLEFGIYSGTGCDDCSTVGCVTWEVTAGSGGADITLQGCCGDSGTTTFNLSSDAVINICSITEPIIVDGSATIVNQGICPSCFTPTPTPTPTETPTNTPTPTETPTETPTNTPTPTPTETPTNTPTPTETPTLTPTETPTNTPTPTETPTLTPTETPTLTPTETPTETPTPTPTPVDEVLIDPIITENDEYISVGNDEYLMFVDPSPTPTPTLTPTTTNTPTPTPTMTDPLDGELYYISTNALDLCYNPTVSDIIYAQNGLSVGEILYQDAAGTNPYTITDLQTLLTTTATTFYVRAVSGGDPFRVDNNGSGDAYAESQSVCATQTPTPTITVTPTPTPTPTTVISSQSLLLEDSELFLLEDGFELEL